MAAQAAEPPARPGNQKDPQRFGHVTRILAIGLVPGIGDDAKAHRIQDVAGSPGSLNAIGPGCMGAQVAKRPTSPGCMGAQVAKRPTSPGCMGAQVAKRPTSPGCMGAQVAKRPNSQTYERGRNPLLRSATEDLQAIDRPDLCAPGLLVIRSSLTPMVAGPSRWFSHVKENLR